MRNGDLRVKTESAAENINGDLRVKTESAAENI